MASRRLAYVEPMKAATRLPPSPADTRWLYEVKFDGFRVEAVKNGRKVELWSRNKKRLDERFPGVADAVARLAVERCVIDGEVCAIDAEGKSSFQLLQNSETRTPIVYYVFDAMFAGTRDLRGLPLLERKARLAKVLRGAREPIRPSAHFTEDLPRVLDRMRAVGAEGAIAKLKDSLYETGARSGAWTKVKFHQGQEFVIAGYTLPKGGRHYFGSLILGYYEGKRLVFCGRVGTGFTAKSLREIHRRLKALEIPEPMIEGVQAPSGRWRQPGWKPAATRWVKPKLVSQIRFTEFTSDGILRHPSFQGLRDDKTPLKVVRENRILK